MTLAFEHYATGEWTLQRLAQELAHKGLTGRARRDRDPKAITWQGLAKILANPVYVGIVEWNGVQHPGTHEPLVGPEVSIQVSIRRSSSSGEARTCPDLNFPTGTSRQTTTRSS